MHVGETGVVEKTRKGLGRGKRADGSGEIGIRFTMPRDQPTESTEVPDENTKGK